MILTVPKLSLVVLVGPSGAGKSTFARAHFRPTEVLSSDYCRGLVSDDENDQTATPDAFEVLHFLIAKRLERGKLVVVDATNVQPESRAPLVALARRFHVLPVAVVFDVPEAVCQERNRQRPDRRFGPHVVRQQLAQMRKGVCRLKDEGFRYVFTLDGVEGVAAATVERVPLWTDKAHLTGPFDFVGDVHGCADELEELLLALGYERREADPGPGWTRTTYAHPAGRMTVFVGDLVDRGPRVLDSVGIVRNMVRAGAALCVPGNHDVKFVKALRGRGVKVSFGLAQSLAEVDALPAEARPGFVRECADFLDGLVSHFVLDGGKLVVAHAGLPAAYHGRSSGRVRDFALYGDTTGETDEHGLPVRRDWAADYRGAATVVYGHTPVAEPVWVNRTVNIDTGCVFGGKLTALRYPEREFVSVPAMRVYVEPPRPLAPVAPPADDVLDAADVTGKRVIDTRLGRTVTVRAEQAAAALEVMSRFAADPRWLVYLPPTMSPCETSTRPGRLEHPSEALAYYRAAGVATVVCQEKHMGSRAVVVVCKDADAAARRFGIASGESGVVLTRTGRRFFPDDELERSLLNRLTAALTATGVWDEFATEWSVLDCELMPWSAKAQELLKHQYAAVGSAGVAALGAASAVLSQAAGRLTDPALDAVRAEVALKDQAVGRFVTAYRHYCWPVASVDDLKLAPFHLLATEGAVHVDKSHAWHMQALAKVCAHDPILVATDHRVVEMVDPAAEAAVTDWWEALTSRGGEGMVVKPLDFVATGPKGLLQPAVKCRGPEYLRIIYGPDYDAPTNLDRLRRRGLAGKRSLALREFALGVEGLERFVRREPLRRVHECAFSVLALESEPVDPRL